MMIGIDLEKFPEFSSCLNFIEALTSEQSILAFPGPCFDFPGYFRFVLTVPEDMIKEACDRIQEFCYEHFEESQNNISYLGKQRVKRFTGVGNTPVISGRGM